MAAFREKMRPDRSDHSAAEPGQNQSPGIRTKIGHHQAHAQTNQGGPDLQGHHRSKPKFFPSQGFKKRFEPSNDREQGHDPKKAQRLGTVKEGGHPRRAQEYDTSQQPTAHDLNRSNRQEIRREFPRALNQGRPETRLRKLIQGRQGQGGHGINTHFIRTQPPGDGQHPRQIEPAGQKAGGRKGYPPKEETIRKSWERLVQDIFRRDRGLILFQGFQA